MKRRPLMNTLLLALALTCASHAGPLEEDEARILQIPPRPPSLLHARMAELMGWAIAQEDELTVLRGLQDTANLKITDLTDRVIALLDDARPLVVTTALQTLGALDAKAAADRLLKIVELPAPYSPRVVEQVQMADELVARWKDGRGMKPWAARLVDAKTPMPLRISAARALGALTLDQPTSQALMVTALNEAEPMPLRLAAARSLGAAVQAGLPPIAQALMARGTQGRLLAALLLRNHRGEPALIVLTQLANDSEPAVQAVAMEQLNKTEPQRLWPTAARLITSPDPRVRLLMVQACKPWHDMQPVQLLAAALDDPHPQVRNEARAVLGHLAATHEDLNGPTKELLRNWLETAVAQRKSLADYEANYRPDLAEHWRAAEQAALLTGILDDKPANGSLLALLSPELEHPRLEVRLAVVDAIRRLHMPESRGHMVDLMRRLIERIESRVERIREQRSPAASAGAVTLSNQPDSDVAAETAQALAVWGVKESHELMRRLIPKRHPAYPNARASAIWALGHFYAGTGEEQVELATQLIERLFDQNPLDPEAHAVRLHSCIAVGRMKTMSQLNFIRNRYEQDGLEIKAAARWALMHMTGEHLPPIELEPGTRSDAFIQPIE